ncbi:MAG: peptidyl-tRNA hydrolase [Thermoprotei archaeon]|nr:MAG: peptidyl-tRNA hydrolase [Thermoprotei archaeon]RLF19316.1 MAG: peptidyl-tRNA hydrolase [Thermoprotei archaeon]
MEEGYEEYKQVLILRSDIKMSPGKAAVQAAHAAVSALEEARKINPTWVEKWFNQNQKKIALRADLNELMKLYEKAKSLGLPAVIIRDAGFTELPPNTITALGIGPAPAKLINKVTGHLKLY